MPVEVALRQVTDGTVLAEEVVDARGNVLLAAGTQLTKAHISLMQRRGVKSLTIVVPDDPAPVAREEGVDPASIETCLRNHDRLFASAAKTPLMEVIRKASRAHIEAGHVPAG
ncbi:MAG: hypothetical protein ACYTGB_19245 [Planctomycetota bacterium]|jgi:hypothetical protein